MCSNGPKSGNYTVVALKYWKNTIHHYHDIVITIKPRNTEVNLYTNTPKHMCKLLQKPDRVLTTCWQLTQEEWMVSYFKVLLLWSLATIWLSITHVHKGSFIRADANTSLWFRVSCLAFPVLFWSLFSVSSWFPPHMNHLCLIVWTALVLKKSPGLCVGTRN